MSPPHHPTAAAAWRVPERGAWLLVWVGFVVYGSLLPFDFRPVPLSEAAALFRQMPMLSLDAAQRGDWVANGVLYLPVGALGFAALGGHRCSGLRCALAAIGAAGVGLALAAGVEFAQVFFPPRTVSRNDLLAEALGTLLGVLLAWYSAPWLRGLLQAWRRHGPRYRAGALAVLAVGYLALAVFPFDFLVTAAEWRSKIAGPQVGGWMAAAAAQEPWLRLLARLGGELLTMIPLGWLLAARRVPAGAGVRRAAAAGAGFGVLVELLQAATVSGVAQGASVATRAAGAALGAWLAWRAGRWEAEDWRLAARRAAPWLLLPFGLALAALAGWFAGPWRSAGDALRRLADGEVSFLPFHYHYLLREGDALFSVAAVSLQYAPLAIAAWAWRLPPAAAAGAAALAAAVVEAGKLFPHGIRPDPTNVLVAAGAAGVACSLLWALERWRRPGVGAAPAATVASRGLAGGGGARSLPSGSAAAAGMAAHAPWLLASAGAAAWLAGFPVAPGATGAAMLAAAALVAWRPVALFVLLPPALVAVDLQPWSGRLHLQEVDLGLALAAAVAWGRLLACADHGAAPGAEARRRAGPLPGLIGMLGLAMAVSAVLAFWRHGAAGLPGAADAIGPWFGLAMLKAPLLAWVVSRLALRMRAAGMDVGAALLAGMVLALAGTTAAVAWERMHFVGLLDAVQPYRVAGPMAAMALGGAYTESVLAAALPLALAGVLFGRGVTWRATCALAMAGGGYALALTFTRAAYAAAVVGLIVVLGGALLGRGRARVPLPVLLAAPIVLAALVWPVVTGPFAAARWAAVQEDAGTRLDHWAASWGLRAEGLAGTLFGHGPRGFPDAMYWRAATSADRLPMGVHRFVRGERRQTLLQIGPGGGHFVDQMVTLEPGLTYEARLRARAVGGEGAVTLQVCRKWFLASADCAQVREVLPGPVQADALAKGRERDDAGSGVVQGPWREVTLEVDAGRVLGSSPGLAPPVRLSVSNAGTGLVEVARVGLRAQGDEGARLHNADFAAGGDRWTFTADNHLDWHAKQMLLGWYLDTGAVGLAALAVVLGVAIARAGRHARRGDATALALLAALLTILSNGVFDTLLDTPRFLLLVLVLASVAALPPREGSKGGVRSRVPQYGTRDLTP